MKTLRTTNCHNHQHPEFRIEYDPSIVHVEFDVTSIVEWIEQTVADGTRYVPGQSCQIGWLITEVRQREDGDLSLWEPNMGPIPIVWRESISLTMNHLRLQKDLVESVLDSAELSFPSIYQSAIVCTRLENCERVVMERVESSGRDSGWFIGCREQGHDHNDPAELKCTSLYDSAVRLAPQIIPYLALPAGTVLCIGSGSPAIFRHGESLDFKPGSLLAMRHTNRLD